jgi:hypothetical protein
MIVPTFYKKKKILLKCVFKNLFVNKNIKNYRTVFCILTRVTCLKNRTLMAPPMASDPSPHASTPQRHFIDYFSGSSAKYRLWFELVESAAQ